MRDVFESNHYNRWMTDNIQNYLKNLEENVRILFEPYIEFKHIGKLFGLTKNYVPTNRMWETSDKKLAKSILNKMRLSFKENINSLRRKYLHLVRELVQVQNDIISYIEEYEEYLNPKPTPDYQMYIYHPNFNRCYFKVIETLEQAYWLGFLLADRYIALECKKSGDYYRMDLELSTDDKNTIIRFYECIGLEPKMIRDHETGSDFSEDLYYTSVIRWED